MKQHTCLSFSHPKNHNMQKGVVLILFLILATVTLTEAQSYQEFYSRSLDVNKSGMYFLGGWALANITTGTYGWLTHEGDKKYFHQMNAAWNLVNAGIAGYALWATINTDASSFSDTEIMRRHIRTENIFLINAGLDLLYITGGAWMMHAAKNNEKHHDLLKGYGQSVILQGAFLFVFDLVKFGIQYHHRKGFISALSNVSFSPEGISIYFTIN
jgi:hypothetical protein